MRSILMDSFVVELTLWMSVALAGTSHQHYGNRNQSKCGFPRTQALQSTPCICTSICGKGIETPFRSKAFFTPSCMSKNTLQ